MTLALFLLLVALNLADAALTARIVALGGMERNPLMAAAIRRLGVWPALALVKGVALAVVWVWLLQPLALAILCALFAGICGWNAAQYRKQVRANN